ncbi:aldo-keto reductase family 1 member B1 [Parasteatoda tepidariorum]|uniref:aldo-keto reductase family 1 member B1 n=1 Tax=Parasteatoda tepidariorum TaxID=114398 RepID=UPI00077FD022|nr:aldo-keto reductase family 1 member B1 isoform X1 [Parasteatoda tepidariorum]XP_042900324.1 aldo-keto reductase family 1 member B1 isoform X2 [Parasteatoda tepidariorum]
MSSIKLAPKIKLNNGMEMPLIGLGTWKSKPGEVFEAVKCAIQCGYRHIDCALAYENEEEVGNAIKEKIADKTVTRQDIFVTTKAWNTFHRREKVIESCKRSLKDLQLDYVDLFLIHWPIAYKEGDELFPEDENNETLTENIDFIETWKGMEECYDKGLVKAIGLSNFNSEQIRRVLDVCKIKPVVLQIECHPYLNQNKLIEFCKSNDIAVTAYSPLGSPDRPWNKPDEPCLLDDERIKKLAEKYNKTPAQILLRFNVQREVVVIPKSVTEERIIGNFKNFDFALTQDEMIKVASFTEKFRYCPLIWLKDDSNYPFGIEY